MVVERGDGSTGPALLEGLIQRSGLGRRLGFRREEMRTPEPSGP